MIRPQDTPTRETKRLDGLWRFRADPDGEGRRQRWFAGPLAEARDMPVPASYNDVVPGRELHDHVGVVWYQSTARIPRGWASERVVLRFDSATHRATVWVDQTEVVSHEGGYTPFEADITDLATAGEQIRITVAVDNTLTWESIPPGIVEDTAHGPRQKYMHDFFNYAGLHRPVWLYNTPKTFVEEVTIVVDVEGDPRAEQVTGLVDYDVVLTGPAGGPADQDDTTQGASVRVRLLDAAGDQVASGAGPVGRLRVPGARLWQPGEGHLYQLHLEISDDGGLVDTVVQTVGIRTIEVRGTDFLINGRPFHFTGFGMHEDHLVRGKGQDDVSMIHDFELLHWTGANSLRTSHYPYAEEVLDYADAHGIVVIDETAAVGMNATVAGALGTPIDQVYGPGLISEQTRRTHAQAIRELVHRDRNRPSVVLWSIANEPESHTPESREYFEPLFELTRALDPHRPVGFVNVQFSPAETCVLTPLADVVMINRYYGWYTQTGDLAAAQDALEAELAVWAEQNKPILVTEFGADTIAGLHALTGALWSEEFQTELVEMYLRVFDRHEAVKGEHLWNFADFQTSNGIVRVDGNRKGAFTRERRPKAVAHMLRRRWTSRGAFGLEA